MTYLQRIKAALWAYAHAEELNAVRREMLLTAATVNSHNRPTHSAAMAQQWVYRIFYERHFPHSGPCINDRLHKGTFRRMQQ